MSRGSAGLILAVLLLSLAFTGATRGPRAQEAPPFGTFAFMDSIEVPVPPGEAYDRFVEVESWWDHRVSESPISFTLDPRPGGGFVEVFDESGDGVLHATVISAQRGKLLRMDGPLGLAGNALHMVFTLSFEEMDTGTKVRVEGKGAGELDPGWPDLVAGVWHHFLADRYHPYVEGTQR